MKVRVRGADGYASVVINSEEHGGSVGVYGEKGVAIMTIDKTGGRINVAGHKRRCSDVDRRAWRVRRG